MFVRAVVVWVSRFAWRSGCGQHLQSAPHARFVVPGNEAGHLQARGLVKAHHQLAGLPGCHTNGGPCAVRVIAAMRRPFGPRRVVALIFWQALKLRLKGVGYRPRPLPPQDEVTR